MHRSIERKMPARIWYITNASPYKVANGYVSHSSANIEVGSTAELNPYGRKKTDAVLRSVRRTATTILLSSERSSEERASRLASVFQKARSSCSEDVPLTSILNEPLDAINLPPLVYEILHLTPTTVNNISSASPHTGKVPSLAVVRFLIENWDGSLIYIPSIGRGDLSRAVRKACLCRGDDDSGNSIFQMIRPLVSSKLAARDLDKRVTSMTAPRPSTDFSIDVRPLHETGVMNTFTDRPSEQYAFETLLVVSNLHGHLKSSPMISRRSSAQSFRGDQGFGRPLPSPIPSPSPTSGWFRELNHVAIFSVEFLANNCAWSFELGQNSIKLTLLESQGFRDIDSFFVEAVVDLNSPSATQQGEENAPFSSYRFPFPTSRLYLPAQPRRGTSSVILAPCFRLENGLEPMQDTHAPRTDIYGFDDERLKVLGGEELSLKLTVRLRRPFSSPRRVQGPRPASTQLTLAKDTEKKKHTSRFSHSEIPPALHPIKEDIPESSPMSISSFIARHEDETPARLESCARSTLPSLSSSSASSVVTSLFSAYPQSSPTIATSVEPSSSSLCLDNVENTEEVKKLDSMETKQSYPSFSRTQKTQKQASVRNEKATKVLNADINALSGNTIRDGWRRTILEEIEEVYGIDLPHSRRPVWEEHDLETKTWVHPFSIYLCLQYLFWNSLNGVVFVDVSTTNLLLEIQQWQKWPPLSAIANISIVRATVLDIIRLTEMPNSEVERQSSEQAWKRAIHYALKRDNDDLTRLISAIVAGGDTAVKEITDSPEKDFYAFTEVLQQQIDKQVGPHRMLERFLQKIVRITGRLPQYLFVPGAKRHGENPLAGGGFADVWKGEARGLAVALKVLRIFGLATSTTPLQEFCMEAMIWRQLRHRNILPFYGVCVDEFSPQLALVSPWMVNGDVVTYMKRYPSVNRVLLATEIASGVAYLHSLKPVVVHGDLRAANVLVDDRGCPKVADFGLAKVIDSQASAVGGTSFCGKGAMRWQSPELLNSSRFEGIPAGTTTSSDVYAFACVCLEIFTDEIPFYYLRDGEVVLEVAIKDTRPRRPAELVTSRGLSDAVWDLMQRCWATHPSARPDIETVLQELNSREIQYAALNDL